jgi:HD-like signal output (HDOD) protein
MGYIAVENLKEGMVLDQDVHDLNTRLLLSKGQKVAQRHIRVLKIWGVTGVRIIGKNNEGAASELSFDDKNVEHLKKTINLTFQNADLKNELIKEIYKASLIQRLISKEKKLPGHSHQSSAENGKLVQPEKIREKIDRGDIQLPETPTIISELNKVIDDPFATSDEVAQIVHTSPSLAAMLLKIVNSAYYGFPSRIDRISRAVTIIGTKEISGLALGLCVMQAFKDIPEDIINMKAFIRHSLVCGMVARILAALNNVPQTEQLFVCGLLHDVGKLIIHMYYPDHGRACLQLGTTSDISVFQAEKQIIGMTHPQFTGLLLDKWKFPAVLTDNIVYHHVPDKAPDSQKAGIVHLADIIANGLGIGSSGERSIPRFDYTILENLAISTDTVKMVVRQAVHQFGPMDAIFNS